MLRQLKQIIAILFLIFAWGAKPASAVVKYEISVPGGVGVDLVFTTPDFITTQLLLDSPAEWDSCTFRLFGPATCHSFRFTVVGNTLNFDYLGTFSGTTLVSNNGFNALPLSLFTTFGGPTGAAGSQIFITVSPVAGGVPEPAVWILLVVAFGLVGATMRQTRSSTASAIEQG